ncbi:MAG: DUF11 domain-containing protein, partial [Candidatus Thermoplasmatota archaeon]|nr:DUF11 domain-containing protein [Candidatus Thermoplasmatota archaeon]
PTPGAPNDRKRPIMDVDKTVTPLTAEPGQYVTYTIWYNNTGDGNAKDVWVNDTLPAGVDFISSNPAPTSISGQDLVWYFNSVVHDTTNFITVTVEVNEIPADGEVVTNNVGLVYHDALKRPMGSSMAQASFTCVRPQITVEKVADVTETTAGGTIVYTIYYNNTGTANAGSVWINDTLPAGVTFVSANPAPDSITGLTLYWHFTSIAPGTHSITVTVTVNATTGSGTIVNWAYLDYSSGYGYSLESSSDLAMVIVPEFGQPFLGIMGIMGIILISRRFKTSRNR